MEGFLRVVERKLKPPFKYFALPVGSIRGDFYTSNSLREIKRIAEEKMLVHKCTYKIMNVFYNSTEGREGYMSQDILTLDTNGDWYKAFGDYCLHTAFFFADYAQERWNPEKYKKLKAEWQKDFEREVLKRK